MSDAQIKSKFRRQLIGDTFLFARAFVLTVIARLLLWSVGYRKTSKICQATPSRVERNVTISENFAYRAAWAVSKASRIVRTDKPCLAQSLVLRHILSRRNIGCDIIVGVQKNDDGSIKAHAWVERNTEVLIGGASSPFRYTVLKSSDSIDL